MMPSGEFAAVLESILVDTGFADQRAAKMDIDDLLKCVFASKRCARTHMTLTDLCLS
jgi:hypothetical protein